MNRIATILTTAGLLAAFPLAAQDQNAGGAPGGGSQMGSMMPSGAPGDTPAPGNIGQLEHITDTERFAFERSGSKKAVEFEQRVALFKRSTGPQREEAMALGIAARKGEPVSASSGDIRGALEQDLVDWRETFKIPRKDWKAIHDQLVPHESELDPSGWAQRRASWVQASDDWIAQQRESLGLTGDKAKE